MRATVKSIADIYALRFQSCTYDAVAVDVRTLKYDGVLQYAIKYAFWALKLGGILTLIDEGSKDDGVSNRRLDFWQVKHELFKGVKSAAEVMRLDNAEGVLVVKKVQDPYRNDGFSFGIIFSGNQQEIPFLTQSVRSILDSAATSPLPFEIIVCGPSSFDFSALTAEFGSAQFRYHAFDFDPANKRVMIAAKKAELYLQCQFNVVAINHTRILYAADFTERVAGRKFDAFIPRVDAFHGGHQIRYLDYSLLESYNMAAVPRYRSISASMIDGDFLYSLKRRVPYMDGGINVFNKATIDFNPFCPHIAWGEGEDIMTANMLTASGALIDYFDDILCTSSTVKIAVLTSPVALFKQKLKKALVRRGLY
ncbi:MAG: hypothetical protein M0P39_05550 [Rhodocyclaceae bacterium]|nr:hypothetical protein [Rhodocyclaceae bacterium]